MRTILIDDREKTPFGFPSHDGSKQVIHKLRHRLLTGDYSLLGLEDFVAIERKKASELFHTVGAGRKNFIAELRRMEVIINRGGYAAIVVEGSLRQVIGLGEASDIAMTARGVATAGVGRRVTAEQVIGTLTTWSVMFRVPVWFAGGLAHAEALTFGLLCSSEQRARMRPASMRPELNAPECGAVDPKTGTECRRAKGHVEIEGLDHEGRKPGTPRSITWNV